tara:strand:+ start:133 stop:849 length:717 start_codon:yes stop_codon:yes gene_type:complete
MILHRNIKDKIKDYSLRESPNECCGLIVNDQSKGDIVFLCKNISDNPRVHFEIDTKDYLRASQLGEIVAVFHSHVNGDSQFSELDKQVSNGLEIQSILYSVKENKFNVYYPNDYTNEYVGRKFEIGKSDCFSVMRDFFMKELNIFVNNYHRDQDWQKKTPHIYDHSYEKEGFIKVEDGTLKKYDCILFKFLKNTEHIAVYLGDDLILHQPRGKESLIEKYSPSLERRKSYIIRHRSLA